jgi:hypothetical protein
MATLVSRAQALVLRIQTVKTGNSHHDKHGPRKMHRSQSPWRYARWRSDAASPDRMRCLHDASPVVRRSNWRQAITVASSLMREQVD